MTTRMYRANLLLAVFLAAIALVPGLALAQEGHAAHHPASPTAPSATAKTSDGDVMQSMRTMQDQMAKIQSTSDPKERSRLLKEHMDTMQSTLGKMQKSDDCMMDGGMMGNDSMPMKGKAKPKGMNMMQMMMDQMMQHQKAMGGSTP